MTPNSLISSSNSCVDSLYRGGKKLAVNAIAAGPVKTFQPLPGQYMRLNSAKDLKRWC
jgi:hypothetical protein